ncbi:MAG: hypothetical protein ABIQ77_13085 [Anaerolineales bacterium]
MGKSLSIHFGITYNVYSDKRSQHRKVVTTTTIFGPIPSAKYKTAIQSISTASLKNRKGMQAAQDTL